MNFGDLNSPYPQLEIVNEKQEPHVRVLVLWFHPLAIDVFLLDKGSSTKSSYLTKCSTKEVVIFMTQRRLITPYFFILQSSTHDKEVVVIYPKDFNKGFSKEDYPQFEFNKF